METAAPTSDHRRHCNISRKRARRRNDIYNPSRNQALYQKIDSILLYISRDSRGFLLPREAAMADNAHRAGVDATRISRLYPLTQPREVCYNFPHQPPGDSERYARVNAMVQDLLGRTHEQRKNPRSRPDHLRAQSPEAGAFAGAIPNNGRPSRTVHRPRGDSALRVTVRP